MTPTAAAAITSKALSSLPEVSRASARGQRNGDPGKRHHGLRVLRHGALVAASAMSSASHGESFRFELVDVSREPHRVIATSSIDLKSKIDLHASPEGSGSKVNQRELRLPGGWAVGCSDNGDPKPKGFGCWLGRRPSKLSLDAYDGFSWEWYDLQPDGTYTKRKGGARARLTVGMDRGVPAMQSLEFLDDTVFAVDVQGLGPGKFTHVLRIAKGSVLPLAMPAAR